MTQTESTTAATTQPRPHEDPERKQDIALVYDCAYGNPNGDPDNDGAPRIDPQTMHGWVSRGCINRKIRDYVVTASEYEEDPERLKKLDIFYQKGGVLNETIRRVYEQENLPRGKRVERAIPDPEVHEAISRLSADEVLPEGFVYRSGEDSGEEPTLVYSGELSPTDLKAALDALGDELPKKARRFVDSLAKEAGKPESSREVRGTARQAACRRYWDVRVLGATMTTGLNAGQVQGPVQVPDHSSIDPVMGWDTGITRSSVTREEDREKVTTMGNKHLIPYGIYRANISYNVHDGRDTGLESADLSLLWRALSEMWDFDRSSSRGLMTTQVLGVFSHDHPMGMAPSQNLRALVRVEKKAGVEYPRSVSDYDIRLPEPAEMPEGVTFTLLVGPGAPRIVTRDGVEENADVY